MPHAVGFDAVKSRISRPSRRRSSSARVRRLVSSFQLARDANIILKNESETQLAKNKFVKNTH
jgi:hypothetical protein